MTELRASSDCPICGKDTPHHHTPEEIEAAKPTVTKIIADCRAKAKQYRMGYGSGETVSVSAVAEFFDSIADKLERCAP